ncbi:MAG: hypothetical protein OEY49_19795, partial [Candidatus Heimdallarchaeota archaeon]|nr:hypothetical protein [Candidatus Heimdallarchaeota archaeon]
MTKVLISQRWDSNRLVEIRELATLMGMSITKLTMHSFDILEELLQSDQFINLAPNQRIKFIRDMIKPNPNHQPFQNQTTIKERIFNYLQSNPNVIYSTTELANILNLNQATVR